MCLFWSIERKLCVFRSVPERGGKRRHRMLFVAVPESHPGVHFAEQLTRKTDFSKMNAGWISKGLVIRRSFARHEGKQSTEQKVR